MLVMPSGQRRVIAALFALLIIAGCDSQPRTHAGLDRKGKPTVTQSGPAATPANSSVTTTVTTLSVPAGSVVTCQAAPAIDPSHRDAPAVTAPGPVTVTLSQPSELRTETRREAVEGAKTPEPPPPPSPVEIAKGKGVALFYGAAAVCAVLAVVSFVRKYFYAGLCFAAGALALPLGVNLVSSEIVIRCVIGLVVAGVVFVAAWKILAARHGLDQKTTT